MNSSMRDIVLAALAGAGLACAAPGGAGAAESYPARTPPAIVDRIHKESVAVLNSEEVQAQLANLGLDAQPSRDPASFHALIKSDHARWDKVVTAAGLRQR